MDRSKNLYVRQFAEIAKQAQLFPVEFSLSMASANNFLASSDSAQYMIGVLIWYLVDQYPNFGKLQLETA